MKKMKKLTLFFLVLAGLFVSFNFLNVNAATAPSSIKVKSKSGLYYYSGSTAYISGHKFYRKVLSDGTIAYCVSNNNRKVPAGQTLKLQGEITDKGLDYILKNGYPNRSFYGDANRDFYITQSAIWLYYDLTNGSKNWSGTTFNASSTGIKGEVYKLVQEALAARNGQTKEPTINLIYLNSKLNLNNEGTYYVSDPIQVVLENTKGVYDVILTEAPNGTVIKDKAGVERTSFNNEESFIIYVPASSVKNGESGKVSLKVSADGVTYVTYKYASSDSKYQVLAPSTTYEKVTKITSNVVTFTFESVKTQLKISKQDITSKEELPGATLEIKDQNGKLVEKWVSTNEPHYIEGLEPGEYTLTETIAPDGYVLSSETITFTLKADGKVTSVVMYNAKETKVTKVKISKQDITSKEELPGATLQIKDKEGKLVEEWVSTNEPHYIEGLEPGEYTLTETIAPDGYALSSETITFTVKDDGSVTSVVMYNAKYTEVPITDLNVNSLTIIFASILITLGTGMVVYYVKYSK